MWAMKNKTDIKVSIIVAIYNVAPYLEKLIQSLMTQTYRNIEIILVNDGSTDKSKEILDTYATRDSRIIVVHQENAGGCAARNIGLSLVTGEYFTIIDGDDWVEPDYVEYLLELAISMGADMALTDDIFTTRDEEPSIDDKVELWNPQQTAATIIWRKWPMGSWNKLYRTKIIRSNSLTFSVPWWGEGMYFATMAAQYSNACAKGHKRIYHYRQNNPNSAVTKYNVQAGINSLWNIKNIKKVAIIKYAEFDAACDWHIWYNYHYLLKLIIATNSYRKHWIHFINCLFAIRIWSLKLLISRFHSSKTKFSIFKHAIIPIYYAKKTIHTEQEALARDLKKI